MEKFSDYILLEKLASGGMANIFRAVKVGARGFRKYFVIKRILTHISEDKTVRDMFIKEAHTLASMEHKNIVQIHELAEEDNQYYITMDYIHGRDVRQLISAANTARYSLNIKLVFYLMYCVINGLEYAHEIRDDEDNPMNIVHRDVNPNNILLSFSGDVKIIDFGIVKSEFDDQKTQQGIIKGKLAYLSPEQLEGRNVDRRTDIFAVGILFYELLSGKRLFTGDTETAILQSLMSKDIREEISGLDIDEKFASILYKLLDRDLLARYQSLTEVKKDLLNCRRKWEIKITHFPLQDALKELFPGEIEKEKEKVARYNELIASGEYLKKLQNKDEQTTSKEKQVIYQGDETNQKEKITQEQENDEVVKVPSLVDDETRMMLQEDESQDEQTRFLDQDNTTEEEQYTQVLSIDTVKPRGKIKQRDKIAATKPRDKKKGNKLLWPLLALFLVLVVGGGVSTWYLLQFKEKEVAQPANEGANDVVIDNKKAPKVAQPEQLLTKKNELSPVAEKTVTNTHDEKLEQPANQGANDVVIDGKKAPKVAQPKQLLTKKNELSPVAEKTVANMHDEKLEQPEKKKVNLSFTSVGSTKQEKDQLVLFEKSEKSREITEKPEPEKVASLLGGTLQVSGVQEGQQLFINGQPQGSLPQTLKLEPGIYDVECRLDSYKTFRASIRLRKNRSANLHCKLEPK